VKERNGRDREGRGRERIGKGRGKGRGEKGPPHCFLDKSNPGQKPSYLKQQKIKDGTKPVVNFGNADVLFI